MMSADSVNTFRMVCYDDAPNHLLCRGYRICQCPVDASYERMSNPSIYGLGDGGAPFALT